MSRGLSVYGSMLDGDNTACADCGVASSNVLSVCLRRVLNINRAEKCPEWNEFVAAWSISIVMMVISGVEEGNTLLCSTAVKQMTDSQLRFNASSGLARGWKRAFFQARRGGAGAASQTCLGLR